MGEAGQNEDTCREVPGPAPLNPRRQEYGRLIVPGVSKAEACGLVGVNRRTGTGWRYGRSVPARDRTQRQYPAMSEVATTPRRERSERYLSKQERGVIADLLRANTSLRAIARELGRSPSTISRELDATATSRAATGPRPLTGAPPGGSLGRARKVAKDRSLGALVQGDRPEMDPEQISVALRLAFPNPLAAAVTDSIYQVLYADSHPGADPGIRLHR